MHEGFNPSCVEALAFTALKVPPFEKHATAFARGVRWKASARSGVCSTMRLAMLNTIPACAPVVAAVTTCGPTSPSQQRQYSAIGATSVDFAFLRPISSTAVVTKRVPVLLWRKPNSITRNQTWNGSS